MNLYVTKSYCWFKLKGQENASSDDDNSMTKKRKSKNAPAEMPSNRPVRRYIVVNLNMMIVTLFF